MLLTQPNNYGRIHHSSTSTLPSHRKGGVAHEDKL
jgi:hypothetical protein